MDERIKQRCIEAGELRRVGRLEEALQLYQSAFASDKARDKLQAALDAGLQDPIASARAHFYLGLIHFRNLAFAWAKQEFEFCEQHAPKEAIARKSVFEMLFHTCEYLGLQDQAKYYKALTRQE